MGQNAFSIELNNLAQKIRVVPKVSKERGIYWVVCDGIQYLFLDSFWHYYFRTFKPRTFVFEGHTYNYFYHKYNRTWENERVVEIPIVWEIVGKFQGKRILEVGNVLSHYFHVEHDIVDKYEKAGAVINQDIIDFRPPRKYDLIVSISTLEHIGMDKKQSYKKPNAILKAIERIKTLLVSGGETIITIPMGFTPELDELLKEGKIEFSRRYCLKRISADNRWVETDWNDIRNAEYNIPFSAANGLVIGLFEK